MITSQDQQQWGYLLDPCFQLVNTAGKPVTNGYIEVYIAGSRVKYYCASDFNGMLHPFQIPLDSLGSNIVLADPANSYDVYVYNAFGTLLMSRYNVKVSAATASGGGSAPVTSATVPAMFLGEYGQRVPVLENQTGLPLPLPKGERNTYTHNADEIIDHYDSEGLYMYLKPGVFFVNATIRFRQNRDNIKNKVTNVKIYTGNGNWNEVNCNKLDCTGQHAEDDYNYIHCTFIRVNDSEDTDFGRFSSGILYFRPLVYDSSWEECCIQRLEIVKLNTIGGEGGQSYIPGDYVSIVGNVISVTGVLPESATGDFVKYEEFNTEIQNIHNEIDNLEITVQNATAQIVEQTTEIVTAVVEEVAPPMVTSIIERELAGVTGDFATRDELESATGDLQQQIDNIQPGVQSDWNESDSTSPAYIQNKPTIKAGDGIEFTKVGTETTISMDSEVGDVVETVEKLKKDLDTQITVNFDIPNITHTYDFANRSVTTLTNGATMLCQAFTIPINHEIRVQTVSEDEPTLLGIYAKQQFGYKIMLALYVYDFDTGFTDYVGDTGPVYVQAGRNEYPLVHKNPNITELTSSCVYYASLYLPSTSQVNGLYLASCPSYNDASYINATPRFTVGVENITYNNQEIDMTDATTGRLDYSDGLGNYYIGPWSDSYNERPSAPRFFMQLRNGTAAEPYVPVAPFTTLGANAMPTSSDLCSNLPNFTPSANNSCFRDVTPEADCDVTYFEWLDDTSSAAGWVQSNCVYNSGFDTNLSGNNNVVTNLGEVTTIDGHSLYRHRLTFGTALHLTANVTYRFLCEAFTDTGYVFSRSNNTNTIHVINNGWYIGLQNMTRYNNIIGKYLKVCADGTDYEI